MGNKRDKRKRRQKLDIRAGKRGAAEKADHKQAIMEKKQIRGEKRKLEKQF